MTVRRATRAAAIYGQLRAVLVILDDVDELDMGIRDLTADDIELAGDMAMARQRIRAARDRLYDQVRRDVDAGERLELEVDRFESPDQSRT